MNYRQIDIELQTNKRAYFLGAFPTVEEASAAYHRRSGAPIGVPLEHRVSQPVDERDG